MTSSKETPQPPALRLLADALRGTAKLFGPVIAHAWPRLLFLHAIQLGASQFFSFAMDFIRLSGREDLGLIALIAASELIFSLLWSAAWILAVATVAHETLRAHAAPGPGYGEEMVKHFNQIVIEQTRSMAAILWRAPLLIIPALVQYVRLTFVPLIVIFDPHYSMGQVDALKRSRELTRGYFLLLALLVVFSTLVPWTVEELTQGSGGPWIWENPLGVLVSSALTLPINVAISLLLYFVFRGINPLPETPPPAPALEGAGV